MERKINGAVLAGFLLSALLLSRLVMFAAPESAGVRTFMAMILPAMLGLLGRVLGAAESVFLAAIAGAAVVFWAGIGSPKGNQGLLMFLAYFVLVGLAAFSRLGGGRTRRGGQGG